MDQRGATTGRDAADRYRFEGKQRSIDLVSQLVREHAEAFGSDVGQCALALRGKRRYRLRDRVVQTQVERLELAGGNRRTLLDSELGDGLANVAVIVNDLGYAEPPPVQVPAVPGRGLLDLIVSNDVAPGRQPKRHDQLVQEKRDAID